MKTIVSPVLVHNSSRAELADAKPNTSSIETAFMCSEALNQLFGPNTAVMLHERATRFCIELSTARVPQSTPVWFRLWDRWRETARPRRERVVRVALIKPQARMTGDGVYINVSNMLKRAKLLTPKWQRFYIRLIISPAP